MKILILALAATLSVASEAAEFVIGNYEVNLTRQDGTAWGDFLDVELGTFQTGFTPTAGNMGSWGTNFASIGTAGYYDPSGPEWSDSILLPSNSSPYAAGAQMYLWVYDSKVVDGTSQWLLLSDSSWKMNAITPESMTTDYVFTSGTHVVDGVGSFNYSDMVASTAFATAVPEPSTYAAILGFVTLGLVGYRRFRRR